jgi:hypothetical protein
MPLMILALGLVTIAGERQAAAEDGQDYNVFDRQATFGATDGTLRISERARNKEPSGTSQRGERAEGTTAPPLGDDVALNSGIGVAFCAEANSVIASGRTPEIQDLCGLLPPESAPGAIPSRGEVLGAFRELGLFRGVVWSDPGRVSFVNLETYFWCGDAVRSCAAIGEGERTVALLGQAVRIRPRIVGYEWRFGDGGGLRTSAARVAHTYSHSGAMAVSVTLTWTADYAVGGGGFRPVEGTTTTTSPVRVLPVEETQAVAR